MTVRAAPVPRSVTEFVRGGGTPSEQAQSDEAKTKPVLLNVPGDLLERIDRAVAERPVRTPRHTWILEAIVQRLESER